MQITTIAGLYMGEGHFTVSKHERAKGKWQFACEVGFSNSDPTLVDYVCSWQESLGIHHYISQNSQGCYQLKVQRYGDVIRVITELEPFLFGNKKAEAALTKRFAARRLLLSDENKARTYTQEDHDIVDQKRQLKLESSETTCVPACVTKHYNGDKLLTCKSGQPLKFDETAHKWRAVKADDIVPSSVES